MIHLIIEQFKEEIGSEHILDTGFIFILYPILMFKLSKGVECLSFWIGFKNVQYCLCLVFNDKRFKELTRWKDNIIFNI